MKFFILTIQLVMALSSTAFSQPIFCNGNDEYKDISLNVDFIDYNKMDQSGLVQIFDKNKLIMEDKLAHISKSPLLILTNLIFPSTGSPTPCWILFKEKYIKCSISCYDAEEKIYFPAGDFECK